MRNAIGEVQTRIPRPADALQDARFWLAVIVAAAVAPVLYTASQTAGAGDVLV